MSQIHPRAFAHPEDIKVGNTLREVPLLPDLLRSVSRINAEQKFRSVHMLNSIQVGPGQFYSIWSIVCDVASRFDMPEPAVYLSRHGGTNAFAFGVNDHAIVLTSGLVDLMTDEELEAIIAHELSHVLCQHMLYKSVGMTLAMASTAVNPLRGLLPSKLITHSTLRLLFRWNRAAEYSADRAALLVLRKPDGLVRCLGKLAGIPRRFADEFEPERFAHQVQELKDESTPWSNLVNFGMDAFQTHPEPAKRAAAILQWANSEEYKDILAGRYMTKMDGEREDQIAIEGVRSCALCGLAIGEASVCPECGLPQLPNRQVQCPAGHINSLDWRFCRSCGASIDA